MCVSLLFGDTSEFCGGSFLFFYNGHICTCNLANSKNDEREVNRDHAAGSHHGPAHSLPLEDIPDGLIQRLHCPTRASGLSRNLTGQRYMQKAFKGRESRFLKQNVW